MHPLRLALAAGLAGLAAFAAAQAQVTAPAPAAETAAEAVFDATEKRAIEEIVTRYLIENPDVLVTALQAYQQREEEQRKLAARDAIAKYADVFASDRFPVLGNPSGDVTVVEFFDYQCGYCKRALDDVNRLIEADPQVRVVMVEFPILSETSVEAAKAALAAHRLDPAKYAEFHNKLMAFKGRHSEATIRALAREVGLDAEALAREMASNDVEAEIAFNREIARALGVSGTPGFLIGDELIPGAIGLDELKAKVDAARQG